MKLMIIGRNGSGREKFATKLSEMGLTVIDDIETVADEDCLHADAFVIDPSEIETLTGILPETCFHIVYIVSSEEDRKRVMQLPAYGAMTDDQFANLNRLEDTTFSRFELDPLGYTVDEINVRAVHQCNDGTDDAAINHLVNAVTDYMHVHRNLGVIVRQCAEAGILTETEPGRINVAYNSPDGGEEFHGVSFDCFTDLLMQDSEGLAFLMRAWIAHQADIPCVQLERVNEDATTTIVGMSTD